MKKIKLLKFEYEIMIKKGLRKGQSYFNALHKVDWILAEKIKGSNVDPFYNDTKIPQFLETVTRTWDKENA